MKKTLSLIGAAVAIIAVPAIYLLASSGTPGCEIAEWSGPPPQTFSGFIYAYGLAVGDINKDGRLDVTIADAWRPIHDPKRTRSAARLHALMNKGGSLEKVVLADTIAGDEQSALFERHILMDVDNDGDLDVVAGLIHQDALVWLENKPGGNWPEHRIENVYKPVELAAADLNGDGQKEIIVGSFRKGGVRILEKSGDDWRQTVLAPDGFDDTRMVKAADINGDGKLDIVAASRDHGHVVWFSNPDWTMHEIGKAELAWHGDMADMDGDGDLDVVVPSRGIEWFEVPGFKQHRALPSCSPLHTWFEVKMADLDKDGDLDFVGSFWPLKNDETGSIIAGFKDGSNYKLVALARNWGMVNSVEIADLDGDGGLDVIAATEQPFNEVKVWMYPGAKLRTPASAASISAAQR